MHDLHRRGWIIQASCSRHTEPTINYSVTLAEHLINRVDPPMGEALAKLRCPNCHMRVSGARVARHPRLANNFVSRVSGCRRS